MVGAMMGDGSASSKRTLETAKTFQRVQELIASHRYREAKSVLDGLEPRLRKEKSILIAQLTVAASLDVDGSTGEYARAIAAFEEQFPDDPALELLSIDGYFLKGETDEALAAIDRLDARVGGDPYLDFMRGSMLLEAEQFDRARERAHAALEREPGLVDPHWLLVTVSLREKNFAETVRLFGTLESELGIEMEPDLMALEPIYADFLQSDEYRAWLAAR
jgi:predicted Zn-dependent protease